MLSEEKKKQMNELVKAINKQHGKGTIAVASQHQGARMVRMKTGILSFDITSGGGLVLNSINIFFGKRSQGKSTLALHAIAEQQRQGNICAYIYSEGQLDETHLISCGVNIDELYLVQTNVSEEAVDVVQELTVSKIVSYIVVDSGQGLVPTRILEKAAQQHQGVEAYFIGQLIKKYTAGTSIKSDEKPWCTLTMISQGAEPTGGGLLYPKGGDIQQFFAVQMIEVRAGTGLTTSGAEVTEVVKRAGHQIHFKFRKNKTFPPYKAGMLNYYVGNTDFGCKRGDIDHIFDTVVCGVKYGIFDQRGAWIFYKDEKFNGKQAFSNWLRNLQKDELDKIRDEIYMKGLSIESSIVKEDNSFEESTAGYEEETVDS